MVGSRTRAAGLLISAASVFVLGCAAVVPAEPASAGAAATATGAVSMVTVPSPGVVPSATVGSPEPALASDAVAVRLLARLRDPAFSAHVTFSGTQTVPSGMTIGLPGETPQPGPSMPAIVLESTGAIDVGGGDYLEREQFKDRAIVTEELAKDGQVWSRRPAHPLWTRLTDPADLDRPRLFGVLSSLASLEPNDSSASPPGGATLVRFRAPATTPLDLATIFQQTRALKKPDSGTLEIESRPDGTPVEVHITLTSDDLDYSEVMPSGMTAEPRTYDFTFTFDRVGQAVAIPDPVEATQHVKTRSGIAFDGPAGMAIDTSASTYDDLVTNGPPFLIIRVSRDALPADVPTDESQLLQLVASSLVNDVSSQLGVEFVSAEEVSIDGRPGVIIALATAPGAAKPVFQLEAVTVDRGAYHEIQWHTTPGQELSDWYRFERLVETVKLKH